MRSKEVGRPVAPRALFFLNPALLHPFPHRMLRRAASVLATRGRGLLLAAEPALGVRAASRTPRPSSLLLRAPPTTPALRAARGFASGGCASSPSDAAPPCGSSLTKLICDAADAGTDIPPETLSQTLESASPSDLVSAAAALNACARPPPRAAYASLASALASVAHTMSPRQLAAAASAFADAGHMAPDLKDALADAVTARMRDFDPHTLARTVRAYGALSLHDEGLLDAVAERLKADWRSFDAHDIAAIADATARLGYHSPTLLSAFEAAGAYLASRGDAASLAALADALRRVGCLDPALADRAAALFAADPAAFDAGSLPTLLYALTAAGHGDEAFLRAAATAAASHLPRMKPKDLVRLARAYAWAGVHEAALFEELEREVARRVGSGFAPGVSCFGRERERKGEGERGGGSHRSRVIRTPRP